MSSFDHTTLSRFPTSPGVYLMKDGGGKVLYVGKAKNLRQRVRQYFLAGSDTRAMIPHLLRHLVTIDTIVVASEKEALLVENTLIKQYQPRYNILLRDDKSFLSLMINRGHQWPMVRVVRSKDRPQRGALYFGPYPSAFAARETLDLLNTLFPLRECSDRELTSRSRPCILYEMHRCIAPCVGKCTEEEYAAYVEEAARFLRGQNKEIIASLRHQMEAAAEGLDFERAAALRNRLAQLQKTLEGQTVDHAKALDTDAFGLYREADDVAIAQVTYRHGKLVGVHHYHFSHTMEDDAEILSSLLLQHYLLKEEVPHEILVGVALDDADIIGNILGEGKKRTPRVLTPKRGEKRVWATAAYANAESAFHRERDAKAIKESALADLQERCGLTSFPSKIECFDTSHLNGTEPVAAMVAFCDGEKASSSYRKFRVKTAGAGDDYGAMREVLTRRYEKAKREDALPDLLIVDGGKGHLKVAVEVMDALDISTVEIIALAKEAGRHDKGMTAERVFLVGDKVAVEFPRHSPTLLMLQAIRDEAHRFAITFQRQRRGKGMIRTALTDIPRIGPAKSRRLLQHFGSIKRVLAATDEELGAVTGIGAKEIEALRQIDQEQSP